jgi:hypothetical protein
MQNSSEHVCLFLLKYHVQILRIQRSVFIIRVYTYILYLPYTKVLPKVSSQENFGRKPMLVRSSTSTGGKLYYQFNTQTYRLQNTDNNNY